MSPLRRTFGLLQAAVVLFASALLSLGGCSASRSPGGSARSCSSLRDSALASVRTVAKANVTCVSDADCVSVGVNSSCFDACTTTVNLAGQGAVDRAITTAEASDCKLFLDQKCKREPIPACAPPCAPGVQERSVRVEAVIGPLIQGIAVPAIVAFGFRGSLYLQLIAPPELCATALDELEADLLAALRPDRRSAPPQAPSFLPKAD